MGKKSLEKWKCEDCKTEWYLRSEDVKNKASVEGIVCPFCATYGDHVKRELEEQTQLFIKGDIVRHKKDKSLVRGTYIETAASGKRGKVLWTKENNPRLLWDVQAYYRLDLLEHVDD